MAARASGSVACVDGEPGCEDGKGVFPTLLEGKHAEDGDGSGKEGDGNEASYTYIGNYDITDSVVLPPSTFTSWPLKLQSSFALSLLNSAWGRELLAKKGITIDCESKPNPASKTQQDEEEEEKAVKKLLPFFLQENENEPFLRVRSFFLRWAFFSVPDFEDLNGRLEGFRGVTASDD